MKAHDVLDPSSVAEAEMARVAHQCLVSALDHSNAPVIKLVIEGAEVARDRPAPVLELPPRALRFFADVLRQMGRREPLVLIPQRHELTTQDAANYLNVSRPFLIKLIETGEIPCRLVGTHRRIAFSEVQKYSERRQQEAEDALQALADISGELKLEL
jgi:excisionase family DNA binding protein